MITRGFLLIAAGVAALFAQAPTAPVVTPRGVVNYFTQQPALSRVAPGGLIQINGLNLGPADGVTATGTPWPTRLGDVQVLINGKAVPVYSATASSVIAQVPFNVTPGLADVVVRRAAGASSPAHITINALEPSIRTADGSGYGLPAGSLDGGTLKIVAGGLGVTKPVVAAGDVASPDTPAKPDAVIAAYIGGVAADVTATYSTQHPGEYDLTITVPKGARAGDLLTIMAGARVSNAAVLQSLDAPMLQAIKLPDGSPTVTSLADTGLNGNFLIAHGARGDDGCSKGVTINLLKKSAAVLDDCLTSATPALDPVVSPTNGDSVASLIGPPAGDAQTGISTTVKIYSATRDVVSVTLPSPASLLTAAGGGDYAAVLPGSPAQLATITAETGDVKTAAAGAGAGAGAGTGTGGGAGGGALPNLTIDGLTHVYASVNLGQGLTAVSIGDDATKPTKAEFAIVTTAGAVRGSKPYPAGWLPLLGAVRPPAANQPAAAAPRQSVYLDTAAKLVYAVSRASDHSKDGFIAFALDTTDPKLLAFPDGWFATACTQTIRLFTLDLSGRIALLASKLADNTFAATCAADGFVVLDLSGQKLTAAGLSVQSQLLAATAGSLNDYVYASRLDPTRTGTSDTLFVLDGTTASAFAMSLPNTIDSFSEASVRQVPEINSLIASATHDVRTPGDQGLIVFDLYNQLVNVLGLPDGATVVSPIVDNGTPCCLATRKLVALATHPGGNNIVVYDLVTMDHTEVANPQGISTLGALPRAAGGGAGGAGGTPGTGGGGAGAAVPATGQVIFSNFAANTVAAIGNGGGKQVAAIVVRVP